MHETWKNIHGYIGQYQVSNLGRVKSLSRYCIEKSKSGKLYKHPVHGHILHYFLNIDGYKEVCLSNNGHTHVVRVHRLVAQAFVPNPHQLSEINHKNEIRQDNRAINLEWCSHKYNCNYGNRTLKLYLKDIKIMSRNINTSLMDNADINKIKYIATLISHLHIWNKY